MSEQMLNVREGEVDTVHTKDLIDDLRKCDIAVMFDGTVPTDTTAVDELRALGEDIVGNAEPIELYRCMQITKTSLLPDTLEFVNVDSGVSHSYVRMDDIPQDVRDVVNVLVSYRRLILNAKAALPADHIQLPHLTERQQNAFVGAVNRLSYNTINELIKGQT